ncbi:retrovirus-related pol polyprotein from transposon TNT 1-94 [Tanacetum coccineum]
MAAEVPQILEYMGGQLNVTPVLHVENFTNRKKRFMCHIIDERKAANLDQRLKSLIMSVLLDDQINPVINCLTAKSTWDDLILYHEGPSDVKERRVMDLKLCYNTFKFKEGKTLKQTFTRYKALMNELVNDGIKLLKLEINTGFINGLPKKWLSFCQSLRNTNPVKDSELASLFDSPDDEEDTRNSQEYLNDLKEEYQARALLAKSERFFKKGTQRFCSAKTTNQTECHKCGKKGHFARDYWSKTSNPSYQSPLHPKPLIQVLQPSKHPWLRTKGLSNKALNGDDEEVSSDDNELVEVKVLMTLAEDNEAVINEKLLGNGDGGREFEEPSHSRQRYNTAVWPEPFLEALATQVAIDAVTSSGRLAAAPAICNLFQVSCNMFIIDSDIVFEL